MTTNVVRKIIKIDEQKCNGCGACALACAEGAIKLVDGKARLISERYCDGLGACIGECPQGALTIEEKESVEFDKEAVEQHLAEQHKQESLPCGCPSSSVMQFTAKPESDHTATAPQVKSKLTNWPVQLSLVPANAPFLKGLTCFWLPTVSPLPMQDFTRTF